ncbi:hypothetical protein MASR2M70_00180 [Bacillota bacterium]
MKMKILLIFILCLFIGSSCVVLAAMSNGRYLFVSPRVLKDYEITIQGERSEIENLRKSIDEGEKKVEQLLAMKAADEDPAAEVEAKLFQELGFYGIAGGFADVVGPGVEVIIDDGTREIEAWENPNDILVHDLDLLMVINELKAAGAEVISVNGQRILNSSSITCSGYTVRINGQFYGKPFRINAIGDGSRMSAALIGPGGYGTDLKDWGLIFKVSIMDSVKIPAFKEERAYKYMSMSAADKKKEGTGN